MVLYDQVVLERVQQVIGHDIERHEVLLVGQRTEGFSIQMIGGHVAGHILADIGPDLKDHLPQLLQIKATIFGK